MIALNIAILIFAYRAARSLRLRSLLHRRLDVLLLGRTMCADVLGRSAHLLASFARLLLRARTGLPDAAHENPVPRSVQRIGRRPARSARHRGCRTQRSAGKPHALLPGQGPLVDALQSRRRAPWEKSLVDRMRWDRKTAADFRSFRARSSPAGAHDRQPGSRASPHRSDLCERPTLAACRGSCCAWPERRLSSIFTVICAVPHCGSPDGPFGATHSHRRRLQQFRT